ncbi:MAG: hypothetical protein K2G26_02910 [Clostridia bacterium]|nr:hypothetical protein [Clostridia bacterium]
MKDFKSYSQNGAGATGAKSGGTDNAASSGNANVNQTVNMAAMLAKAFEGKSEAQIFQTIIAQAEQGKRDGTLTNADLDNFYNTLAPLLDGFKRQRLKGIIAKLKAI